MNITFNGKVHEISNGLDGFKILEQMCPEKTQEYFAYYVNGILRDLSFSVLTDAEIEFVGFDSEIGKEIFRHSSAHILADAVVRLYPEALPAIGPSIEDGFYYDFDNLSISEDDLSKIEKEMKKIIKERQKFQRYEISREEALNLFSKDPYKIELIENLPQGETISYYKHGEFCDLCRGVHVPHTGRIKSIKLTKLAGAYWRGDSNNKMLTRVYGTSFPNKEQLQEYLNFIEEAKKRDHRKIGKEMDLFSFQKEGPGFRFFHPNGVKLYNKVVEYWREVHREMGYEEIMTPLILNQSLWKQSGHYDNYRENMYFTEIDEENFSVRPMNCPGGLLVYRNKPHSYRDFPIKSAELGLVHRHEKSGVLHGLFRVRCFTIDDAHIFCLKDQVEDMVIETVQFIQRVYEKFGFSNVRIELSTRPEKSIGTDEIWELAETSLKNALDRIQMEYKVNEGDGAFYGPKIDFHILDCLKRDWQCGTVQLDFSMPERFELEYVNSEGEKERPVMIHRALLGSVERFVGILIENCAGHFPFWLAPEQIILLTVNDNVRQYADELKQRLFAEGIEVVCDYRSESVNRKVRDAQIRKIPLMLTIGEKEMENRTVAVRTSQGKVSFGIGFEDFINKVLDTHKNRIDNIEF